jgi:hypothetical protein
MKQTKIIPFDWEIYNNNREKYKVVTHNGNEVTQLTKFENVHNEPLVGVLENRTNKWLLNGFNYREVNGGYDLQLQYEEEVVESWVNLYRADNDLINTSVAFITEEGAKSVGIYTKGYIKTINLNDLV